MNSYIAVILLAVSVCSAEVVNGNSKQCADQSKLCFLRRTECSNVEQLKVICPVTCGSCSSLPGNGKTYKLTYFDAKLRGEQIRWILEQAGAKWVDDRVSFADWPALKPKTLTGQIPQMEVDGTIIAQSGAIALFVGREFGLAGKNNLETAEVHMIWDMVQETFNAIIPLQYLTDPVEKAAGVKKYHEESLPRLLSFLENRLKGGDEWLVGNKLTLADLVAASLFESQTGVASDLIKASRLTAALYDRVMALPKIQAWIAKRPNTPN